MAGIDDAEDRLEVMQRVVQRLPDRMPAEVRTFLGGTVTGSEAEILAQKGKQREAEKLFAETVASVQSFIEFRGGIENAPDALESRLTSVQLQHNFALRRLGRLVEAELLAREVLLRNLQRNGKYTPRTVRAISSLGSTLLSQGRFAEAEALGHAAEDILDTMGVPPTSGSIVTVRLGIARALGGQDKWQDAA